MPPDSPTAPASAPSPILRIVAVYAVCAAAWILVSDWLVDRIGLPVHLEPWAQTGKGLLFVTATALLLLAALRRYWRGREDVEQRLVRAERLEAIGRLAGGVAHDFNNLLTAITGYSRLLLTRDDLPEEVRSDIRQISDAGDKAAVLTRQLLAYSRRQELEIRVVSLNIVVGGLQRMLGRVMRENIELVVRLDPDLRAVEADSGQIEQILMNLAVNASDAMPEGGVLTIETRNESEAPDDVEGTELPAGPYVGLVVSDTGIGMDEATAAHAFDPFFTTKPEGEGTGLGLASVYGIVKQHRGVITLSTEKGRGATFHICLPVVDKAPDGHFGAASDEREQPRERTGRILVVEDQDFVRETVVRTLQASGYEVVEAENPEQAMAVITEPGKSFDLMVTDIVMPGGTGIRLAARLRHNDPGLRVLYMSGYSEQMSADTRLGPGEAFLSKPFSPRDLEKKVRELIES